jgi:hypothetical protein
MFWRESVGASERAKRGERENVETLAAHHARHAPRSSTDICRLPHRAISFAGRFFLCHAVAFVGIAAPSVAQYHYEAGKALPYKMQLTVSNRTLTEARFYGTDEDSQQAGHVQLSLEYQLMPLLQTENGEWKIRIVFDRAEQLLNRDGEIKKTSLNREALKGPRIDPHEIMKLSFKDSWSRSVPLEGDTNAAPARALAMQLPVKEELIDNPVLAWITSDGKVSKFEDRSEIQLVMPGVNFKECLELVLPPLPAAPVQEATAWTREVPVDLPGTPLKGAKVPPMTCKLSYAIKKTEDFDGKKCVRIALHGRFVQEGLSIPIRQEEMNYLIWTTFVSRIEDEVAGEYLFDLEQGILRSSEVRSTYRYQTFSGRKAESYRGRIVAGESSDP